MITREEIRGAYDVIRPYIRRTPVVQVDLLTGAYKPAPGEHVALVISGANMAPGQLEPPA